MLRRRRRPDPAFAFEAYGVPLLVHPGRPDLAHRVEAMLPPDRRPCDRETAMHTVELRPEGTDEFDVLVDGSSVTPPAELGVALGVLDAQIRAQIAAGAPRHIFIHAGAVAHRGRAILIPGPSFSGKTTLVAALLGAGCAYYSDEFAVLDERGHVRPYAKPLSVRGYGAREDTELAFASNGGVGDADPIPVGLIVITEFRPGTRWRPRRLSAGDGAMALLSSAVPARLRPAPTLAAVRRAAAGAVVLEGPRGEAEEIAAGVLEALDAATRA